MIFFHLKKKKVNVTTFSKTDYVVLTYDQLLKVNGAGGESSSSSSSGASSSSSSSSSSTSSTSSAASSSPSGSSSGGKGSPQNSSSSSSGSGSALSPSTSSNNSTSPVAPSAVTNTDSSISPTTYPVVTNSTSTPAYTDQRYFSDTYGNNFGNHACAATSLLNEISEQYTQETGEVLTTQQIDTAMAAAVNSGNVSSSDASVNNWAGAANDMAAALGLDGSYEYATDSAQADVTIYAIETNGKSGADHFVSDIGNGQYFDPWTGQSGNVSDLNLSTEGLGERRSLTYSNKN